MPQAAKLHRAKDRVTRYDHRKTAAQRGYGSRWQKARASFLESHPYCVHCKKRGKVVLANVVDHIVPHRMDMKLFWDYDNWQPLCTTCHCRKTVGGE